MHCDRYFGSGQTYYEGKARQNPGGAEGTYRLVFLVTDGNTKSVIARSNPLTARVVLQAKPPKGRKHRHQQGAPARNSNSRKNAQRESEPWLLVASPSLTLSARQLITLYGRRMQIELSFRDLKSHRYGQGFEDSLTRTRCTYRSAVAAQRDGRVRYVALGHDMRALRYRRLARAVPIETTPLLGHAVGSRGTRATMVQYALEPTHRSATTPQLTTAGSTGCPGMKTWGNLRL